MKIFFSLFIFLASISLWGQDNASQRVIGYYHKAATLWRGIADYTCLFLKQERINGKLQEMETILLKVKEYPFSVYMKWVKDPLLGQEILYVQGQNNNRLKAHKGGFLRFVTVNLDPYGSMAMKNNYFPAPMAGIGNILKRMKEDIDLARKNREGTVKDLGLSTIHGLKVHCFMTQQPFHKGKKGYQKTRPDQYHDTLAKACFDPNTGLPIYAERYSQDQQLLGKYIFLNLKLNTGLTPADFDPKNKAYRF